jgi:hypothetical protein
LIFLLSSAALGAGAFGTRPIGGGLDKNAKVWLAAEATDQTLGKVN